MDFHSIYINIKGLDEKEKLEGFLKERCKEKGDVSDLYKHLKDKPFIDRHFLIIDDFSGPGARLVYQELQPFISCFDDVHIIIIWQEDDYFGADSWNYSVYLDDLDEDEEDKTPPENLDDIFSVIDTSDDSECLYPEGWFDRMLDEHEKEPKEWLKNAEEIKEFLYENSDWQEFARKFPEAWNKFVDALGEI